MSKVVHCKKDHYDVYIGRPSEFGNPFSFQKGTLVIYKVKDREEAIEAYERWLLDQPELVQKVKQELKGKVLGCWCAPLPCHGDVLVRIANEEE